MSWRARVVDDFPSNGARLHVAELRGEVSDYVVRVGPGRDTMLRSVQPGEVGPEGMYLPGDALVVIRDALDVYLGRPRDDFRARYEEARDALQVERDRVNQLLAPRVEVSSIPPTPDEDTK